jgi:hypothetical protein
VYQVLIEILPWFEYGTGPTRLPLLSFVMGLSFDYLTILGGSRGLFFGIEYKFNSIICILYIYIYIYIYIYTYIYIKIKEDFYIIFPEFAPGGGFCCCYNEQHFVALLARRSLLRPPLALVGDRHPNSHVTDANAGQYAEAYFVRGV